VGFLSWSAWGPRALMSRSTEVAAAAVLPPLMESSEVVADAVVQ
jgi:hypothetical protein